MHKKLVKYVLEHEHKYGTTIYFFKTYLDPDKYSSRQIAKVMEIDFEPDKNETVDVYPVENGDKLPILMKDEKGTLHKI